MAEKRGGVVPGSDSIRSALKWLSQKRLDDPGAQRMKLIEEAALRFDLTPLEVDFLSSNWKEG
jgi:hypothetical protein